MVSLSQNRSRKKLPIPAGAPDVAAMFESCLGCKWTLHVLAQVRRGVNRPGAIERSTPGLTAKVLAERLAKLVRFGVLGKTSYPEVPPRVEYHLTPFGQRFVTILDDIDRLRGEIAREG